MGYNIRSAVYIFKRDRKNHKSPNSAHPESVAAGLLGIELGGAHYYFGQLLKKPTIGDMCTPVVPGHISASAQIMMGAETLTMVCTAIVAVLVFIV